MVNNFDFNKQPDLWLLNEIYNAQITTKDFEFIQGKNPFDFNLNTLEYILVNPYINAVSFELKYFSGRASNCEICTNLNNKIFFLPLNFIISTEDYSDSTIFAYSRLTLNGVTKTISNDVVFQNADSALFFQSSKIFDKILVNTLIPLDINDTLNPLLNAFGSYIKIIMPIIKSPDAVF